MPAAKQALAPDPSMDGDGQLYLGNYQLMHEIGFGAAARVLFARHIHPRYAENAYALKLLRAELSDDEQWCASFRNEACLMAMLDHPNIVQTYEAGIEDGQPFIAMEYVAGRDLHNLLVGLGDQPLPLCVGVHIVGEVLRALQYAHEIELRGERTAGIVHRDVKPSNVLISYDGHVKLGDFGIAAAASGRRRGGDALGTLGHSSPEQLVSGKVDQRSDLFAVGALLYELCCGRPPFSGDTDDELVTANGRVQCAPPHELNSALPAGLEQVILRAMQRKPCKRYTTAAQMLAALDGFVGAWPAMRLLLASLMRGVFHDLRATKSLPAAVASRSLLQPAIVLSSDPGRRVALEQAVWSAGWRPLPVVDPRDIAQLAQSAPAVLVDADAGAPSPEEFDAAIIELGRAIVVVAACVDPTPEAARRADELGAVDLLLEPLSTGRVASALSGALAAARSAPPVEHVRTARPRLLLVSPQSEIVTRVSATLRSRGYLLDVVPSAGAALARLDQCSYPCVLYDTATPDRNGRGFATAVRRQVGIGMLPILFLADEALRGHLAGLRRTAARPRSERPGLLLSALDLLLAQRSRGRAFVRYSVQLPAELRFRARAVAAVATDLSRGGVRLQCEQIPARGTLVTVALRPGDPSVIEAAGRVVHITPLSAAPHSLPALGIEFTDIAAPDERRLIELIRGLES